MGAISWTGLIALVLFVNVQVQGYWLNVEPAAVVAPAYEDSVERDGVTCLSPDDCLADECCLASVRPKEKRSARTKRWFFETAPSEGVCQRLGTDGSRCVFPSDGIFPDPTKEVIALEFSPCAAEFDCIAEQGEIGSCEPKQQPEPENRDEIIRLFNDEEDGVANNEDPADNDNPSENDNADNDTADNNNNYNADEAEPVSEEKDEDEEKAEEWEDEKPSEEEEKPLENTIDDFPGDSDY